MPKLKIGRIAYTNTWPIFHFFDITKFNGDIEFIPQVPSQLNKQMAEGTIDLGPISSFSYAEQAGKYMLLPDLSVSSYGPVGSINLFLKSALRDVANKKIALTNTSATSVNLLKIIIEEFLGGKPEYISLPPNLDFMMEQADAALLIGDEAIVANWENAHTNKYQVVDLGSEWLKRTNLWMTFAIWAVRKEVVLNAPELLYKVYQEFLYSKKKSRQKLNLVIEASIAQFGKTHEFWGQYFNGLTHDFGPDQIKGLKHYYSLAQKIGVLKKIPEIEIVDFDNYVIKSM